RVKVIAGGKAFSAWRTGGGSYQSASDGRLHFGIGPAEHLDLIEVTWPSGRVQRFEGLPADRGYLLRESGNIPRPLPGFSANGTRVSRGPLRETRSGPP